MTFLDLHPLDPREARFKIMATLVLLSELGALSYESSRPGRTRAARPTRSCGPANSPRGASRLVRPPRSC